MKIKSLKKSKWVGFGVAVGLATIALSSCAPILASCNENTNEIPEEIPGGGSGQPNPPGGGQQNIKKDFKSDVLIDGINEITKNINIEAWRSNLPQVYKVLNESLNKIIKDASWKILTSATVKETGIIENSAPNDPYVGIVKLEVKGNLKKLNFDPDSGVSLEKNLIVVEGITLFPSYYDVGTQLFNFENFLIPCENTKNILVCNQYANYADALANAGQATANIRNQYRTLICDSLGLKTIALTIDEKVNDDFKFAFNIELNDSTCRKLYYKSFDEIKGMIENSQDYNKIFEEKSFDVQPIKSIRLNFEFEKQADSINDNLICFSSTNTVNLTFKNGSKYSFAGRSKTNYRENYFIKQYYFVKFDNHSPKNWDVINLETITISEEQLQGLIKVVKDDLSTWTKDDILFAKEIGNSLFWGPSQEPITNNQYKKTINDVNNYLKENNINLEIEYLGIANQLLSAVNNNLTGVIPYFYLKEFKYVELPTQKMFFSLNLETPAKYWYIGFNANDYDNFVPTAAKCETLKLSQANVDYIRSLIEKTIKDNVKTRITDNNDPIFKNLANQINNYLASIDDKFTVNTNIWGADNSYEFDEKTNTWKMSLALNICLKNSGDEKQSFVGKTILPTVNKRYPLVESEFYQLGNVVVFNKIETSIAPNLVIPSNIASELNTAIANFAQTLTTKQSNTDLFNKNPEFVQELNSILAKINPRLKVTGFNVWGGWDMQETIGGYKTLNLGVVIDSKSAGFIGDSITDDSETFEYDECWNVICPTQPYSTNIKA